MSYFASYLRRPSVARELIQLNSVLFVKHCLHRCSKASFVQTEATAPEIPHDLGFIMRRRWDYWPVLLTSPLLSGSGQIS